MRKSISLITAVLMTILCLAGCGSEVKNIDINAMAQDIMLNAYFSEELTQVNAPITLKRLDIEEGIIEECVSYAGTRAVVDEVVILKAVEGNADTVEEKVIAHINSQKSSYSSYRPEEVPKLEDCVIEKYDNYVVLVVSADNAAAKQTVEEYLK